MGRRRAGMVLVMLSIAPAAGGCRRSRSAGDDAAAAAAPKAERPLVTHPLPGFVIDLPPGAPAGEDHAYDDGMVKVPRDERDPSPHVGVIWTRRAMVGNPVTEQALLHGNFGSSGMLEQAEPLDLPVGGGLTSRTWHLPAAMGAVVLFTAINCGRRTVGVMTLDPPDEARALQRRLLATFRCTPDPAREPVAPPPITLAERGWTEDRSDPTTRTWRRGAERVSFAWRGRFDGLDGPRATTTLQAFLAPAGIDISLTSTTAVGDEPAWHGRSAGAYLLATTIWCGDDGFLAYYLGPDDTRARALLARARCAEP